MIHLASVFVSGSGESSSRFLVRATRRLLVVGTIVLWGSAFGAMEAAPEVEIRSQPFTFADGGSAPAYELTLGKPVADDVALFFISGSGCATVKHRLPAYFAPIHDAIDANLFVLQKRGIDEENRDGSACSSAFRETDHFAQTLSDQQEFINARLAEKSVAPRAVVVIGASEGAVVAARIAFTDRRITHLGLIGGGGGPVRENLRILSADTWYLRNPEGGFADIAADPGNTRKTIWGQTYRYWSELLDVDIGELLLSLDIPIVMAMGEKDRSVPVGPARALEARFAERGKSNFNLMVFPGANHRLEDVRDGKSYGKYFLETLLARIDDAKRQDDEPGRSQPTDGTRSSIEQVMPDWRRHCAAGHFQWFHCQS